MCLPRLKSSGAWSRTSFVKIGNVTGNHWAQQMFDIEEHQAGLDWLLEISHHGCRKVSYAVAGNPNAPGVLKHIQREL